jgi:hypothetical protein
MSLCVYMGGGLTLGLAPKHKLQKKATQKRDIQLACLLHICRQWRANCIYYLY